MEANYWLLHSALSPLEEMEAKQDESIDDPDDPEKVRRVMVEKIKPVIENWSSASREKLRISLAYFIRKPQFLVDRVLGSLQDLSMPEPAHPEEFFQIMWDAIFPGERWQDISTVGVVENNDMMEINDIWTSKSRQGR
jgi:hypothetical protein